MTKGFSQACANNQQPLLTQLQIHFAEATSVLEIGSGTGQHAVYFAERLQHLIWHCSDVVQNHPSINAWGREANLSNWVAPLELQVGKSAWPAIRPSVNAVFTANTAHIMQPDEARLMMQLIKQHLPLGGVLCQYGPFRFDGRYTSQSNAQFDAKLQSQGFGGYRDVAELRQICAIAESDGSHLMLQELIDMPAHNHLLVWRKVP